MTYQVLARKWRPRDFSQLVGQEHVLRALVNALDTQRLHHAYLFTGTRGVGKTTIARVLAKALNCEVGISSRPCGECGACREVDEGRFVDLIEVDAASRTKVDDTRDLLEDVNYAPARGRFKVYLIDEVHMFSTHSFNALLKTLEEPPPHVKFLLATTDPRKLPITILSRCLQFNLKRLGADQIRGQLRRILDAEGIEAEAGALELIATAADGSMRDSLSLLDQAIAFTGGTLGSRDVAGMLGTVGTEQVLPLAQALARADGPGLLGLARALAEFAPDFAQVLGELLSLLRRVAVCQTLGAEADGLEEDPAVVALAAQMTSEECQLYYQLGLLGRRDLPLAPDPQVGFEMALLRMLAFRPDEGEDERPRVASTSPATHEAGARKVPPSPRVPSAASAAPTGNQAPEPVPTASRGGKDRAPAPEAVPTASMGGKDRAPAPEAVPVAPQDTDLSPPGRASRGERRLGALDWQEAVASMEASGLVREFARHCALVRETEEVIELALSPQGENLRSDRQTRALELALQQYLGRAVVVRFSREAGTARTPAQISSQEEAARQAEAVSRIESDPGIQALQRQFGATVERIEPVGE